MNNIHYSSASLLLYIVVAYIAAYLIYLSKTGYKYIKRSPRDLPLYILFILLTVFASIRMVGVGGLGGIDAYNYEVNFKYAFSSTDRFQFQDLLFGYFNKLIRLFTDNVYVYRLICYSIISFGYVYFIKYVCPENVSSLPFITLMIPYLKSFNTMRSSIAIAVFLIGLSLLYRKKDLWAIILILSTMFIHRMSVIYVMFLPFYYILGKIWNRKNARKIIISSVLLAFIFILGADSLRSHILTSSLLDTTDTYYLKRVSGLSANIMIVPTILLVIVWFINVSNIDREKTDKIRFLENLVAFDCIIIPVAGVLGMWRASEYMYIPRLCLWGVLVLSIAQRYTRSNRPVIYIFFFFGFSAWLVYRIMREWEVCGLMPYLVA